MRNRKAKILIPILVLSIFLSACTGDAAPSSDETQAETQRVIVTGSGETIVTSGQTAESTGFYPAVDLSEFDRQTDGADAVSIRLSGTTADCDSDDVTVSDGRITIKNGGSYRLTGDYTGQIVVQAGADDNVQLILDGVNLSGTMAPIYIANCKNASLTLADGTVNTVADSADYTFADGEDEPDAAIFSDCDLTINGNGTLNVTGNYSCGIRSKDDLRIVSGDFSVTSVGDAVKGRDSLQIAGGTFRIQAEGDGLKSNNDEDSERGYIVIDDGDFTVSSGDDGVHAESWLVINGGNLTVTDSYEGLEAMKLELNGGNLDITASDDALNAASPSTGDNEADDWFGQWKDQRQNGGFGGDRGGFDGGMMGDMTPPDSMTTPDGMTPPDEREIPDDMTLPEMPENGADFGFDRGSADRGGRGDKTGNKGGGFGGGMMGGETPEEGVWIRITGGNIRLCGGVDVLDSNGTIEMTGGNVLADTPRLQIYGNPDGIFDANGDVVISGGTWAAFAQSTGSVTRIVSHPSLTVSSRIAAGTAVEVKSADGTVIFSDTAQNGGNVFFITSDRLTKGETYTVTVGDSSVQMTAESIT